MNARTSLIALLAGAALLFAGCQTKDEEPVETVFASLLKLTAADPADYDSFGLSLALDGDYALVGVPGYDGSGDNQGAAYLFLRSQGGADAWGQVKKIVPDDPADGDLFGISVAISGDTVIIGAGGADGGGTDEGAAYIFSRDQGGTDNWGLVKKIAASDADDGDGFGFAVALDGDTAIVGADGADGSGTDQGAAYIFYRDQGGADAWGQVARLVSEEPADTNQYGFAVAVAGDLAVVGSPGESGEGIECGVAYVYSRDMNGADAWGLVKAFSPSDTPDYTWLGTAVATDGALAVIGSAWDDGEGTDRGAAHVLGPDGLGTWREIKKLFASDGRDNDLFGYTVAVEGDYVVAGAAWARGGGTERGQAYLFARNEGGTDNWGEAQRLRASDGQNGDWFGTSLAIDGPYLLVGATGEDGNGQDRGAAYLFKKY
jgi:FG-GAP repeat